MRSWIRRWLGSNTRNLPQAPPNQSWQVNYMQINVEVKLDLKHFTNQVRQSERKPDTNQWTSKQQIADHASCNSCAKEPSYYFCSWAMANIWHKMSATCASLFSSPHSMQPLDCITMPVPQSTIIAPKRGIPAKSRCYFQNNNDEKSGYPWPMFRKIRNLPFLWKLNRGVFPGHLWCAHARNWQLHTLTPHQRFRLCSRCSRHCASTSGRVESN